MAKHLESRLKNNSDTYKTLSKNTSSAIAQDDVLGQYLKEICKIPILTREQETAIAKKAFRGYQPAKEKLVTSNLRFVISIAKKYKSIGLPLMDLVSEGNIGLMKAVEKFDYRKGYHFISYAVWWIKQSITKSINEKSRLIRLPLNRASDIRRIEDSINTLTQKLGRQPSADEISSELETLDSDEVRLLLNSRYDSLSLDAPISDDEQSTLSDVIINPTSLIPDQHLMDSSLKNQINKAMSTLKQTEIIVLNLRFGLNNYKKISLEKIGRKFGLSKERIRQIQKKALKKLKNQRRSHHLNSFAIDNPDVLGDISMRTLFPVYNETYIKKEDFLSEPLGNLHKKRYISQSIKIRKALEKEDINNKILENLLPIEQEYFKLRFNKNNTSEEKKFSVISETLNLPIEEIFRIQDKIFSIVSSTSSIDHRETVLDEKIKSIIAEKNKTEVPKYRSWAYKLSKQGMITDEFLKTLDSEEKEFTMARFGVGDYHRSRPLRSLKHTLKISVDKLYQLEKSVYKKLREYSLAIKEKNKQEPIEKQKLYKVSRLSYRLKEAIKYDIIKEEDLNILTKTEKKIIIDSGCFNNSKDSLCHILSLVRKFNYRLSKHQIHSLRYNALKKLNKKITQYEKKNNKKLYLGFYLHHKKGLYDLNNT